MRIWFVSVFDFSFFLGYYCNFMGVILRFRNNVIGRVNCCGVYSLWVFSKVVLSVDKRMWFSSSFYFNFILVDDFFMGIYVI